MTSDSRRDFLVTGVFASMAFAMAGSWTFAQGDQMYGLIGKMIVVGGKRAELIAVLLEGTTGMPGCLSYVVAEDAEDANAIWITEVWDSKASHDASLSLPAVKQAIAKGKPLIASFSDSFVTKPVGGQGLKG
jgi:quinol monooxygenase YgiN